MISIKLHFLEADELDDWNEEILRYFSEDIAVPNKYERAKQVTIIGEFDGKIVCLGTKYLQYNQQYKEWFWYYRASVAESYRKKGLSMQMAMKVASSLNEKYKKGGPVGLFYEVENLGLIQREAAIWPSGAIFMGYDQLGRQLRCLYFDNAKLGNAQESQVVL